MLLPLQLQLNLKGGGGAAYTLTGLAGTYSLTGGTATLKVGRALTANAGTYSLTGGTAVLKAGRALTANAGSYSLTGGAATLTKTTGTVAYSLTGNAGAYSLTGGSAVLKVGRTLSANAGAYSLTGGDAVLTKTGITAYALTALAGSYLITGGDAVLTISSATDKVGGDDAFHQGWDKEAWKKKQKREDALAETIEATYRKIMGIEPDPVVVEAIAEEVHQESPVEAKKPATFDYSGVAEWLQAQEAIVAQIVAKRLEDELDDEEALLLLL